MNSYLIMFVLLFVILLAATSYVWKRRKHIDEMHGMMVGMTFGMMSGLMTATLFLIPTGNFLYGCIIGSIVGLAFGMPLGRLGGHLGVMEGVMAGPMGGFMGAMLGQMIRPFSIEIFMPFFTFIFLLTMLGFSYAVHCGVSCCSGGKKEPSKLSNGFITWWTMACIVLLGASIILPFPVAEAVPSSSMANLPAYLQQITKETRAEAVQKDGYQEVAMNIVNSLYEPNVLVVKKGVPLRINVHSTDTAGCGAEIVFPDFNLRRIIPAGSDGVIELMPDKAGTFKFHCSMDMARGKLIVQ
ncbi:MAG: cupredoxin domain-containing protein [Candidatus Woesearchaeota archaeon]